MTAIDLKTDIGKTLSPFNEAFLTSQRRANHILCFMKKYLPYIIINSLPPEYTHKHTALLGCFKDLDYRFRPWFRKEEEKNMDMLFKDPVPHLEIVKKLFIVHLVLNLSKFLYQLWIICVLFSRDNHSHCLQLGPILLSKNFSHRFCVFLLCNF